MYRDGLLNEYANIRLYKYLKNRLAKFNLKCEPSLSDIKLHVFHSGIDKSTSIEKLRDKIYGGKNIILIGDNEATIARPGLRYVATNNATDKYKKISDYVAVMQGKEGLLEVIKVAELLK